MISYERAREIADLYYDDVYRFCLSRLRREEEAADVTQDVFLFFQEHYEELEDDNIKAWLYAVANNKIKEEFREIAKREKELIYGTVFGSQAAHPSDLPITAHRISICSACRVTLSQSMMQTVMLLQNTPMILGVN